MALLLPLRLPLLCKRPCPRVWRDRYDTGVQEYSNSGGIEALPRRTFTRLGKDAPWDWVDITVGWIGAPLVGLMVRSGFRKPVLLSLVNR